jgi:methylated-DNA-[protein]-cysteine S-methyltransferase
MNGIEYVAAPPLGLAIQWRGGRIWEWKIAWPAREATAGESPEGRALAAALARYVAGADPLWPDLPLAWERVRPFSAKVLSALREQTAPGKTLTYGQLAETCGRPGGAQAVGQAMARNPWPLVYPCHRVLATGGRPGGFSAQGGLELKGWLLELEAGRG